MHLQHVSENRILDALPGDVRGRLLPQMARIVMPLGMTIHETGHELRHIFFPIDSIVALVCVMTDGAATECAMVGNEGAIGLPLFMGGETTTNRAVVQSAGAAYRLTRQHLEDELRRDDTLLTLLLRYAQSLLVQTIQTAVCNRHHTLDQQLCR